MEALGGLYLIIVMFLLFLAILWVLMPFAIFGTKDKLDILIEQSKETNELLKKVIQNL
jgi:CBS domain containing-hemolysin-like protein